MRHRALAAAAILVWAAVRPAAGAPIRGEAAKVEVLFEPGARGSETLRDDLVRAFLDFGPRWSCIALVDAAVSAPAPTLTLTIRLGEPREETSYEAPLADTERRDRNPEGQASWSARFRVRVEWSLATSADAAEVRSGHFEIDRAQHQEIVGGDAAELARDQAIEWAVKEALRQMCKGSPDALRRRIEEARSAPHPSPR